MKLENLQADATVRGILPDALVTVVSVEWHGSDALTLVTAPREVWTQLQVNFGTGGLAPLVWRTNVLLVLVYLFWPSGWSSPG